MNKITKRSFFSFLSLYLLSSFIFLSLASYWFYTAQLSMQMTSNAHKMNTTSNKVIADVIYAHMMKKDLEIERFPDASIALFDADKKLRYGSLIREVDLSKSYYKEGMTFSLISETLNDYLGLKYIVIQSNKCSIDAIQLRNKVLYTALFVAILIIIIAVVLSYIFLKPIRDKMQEVENFIKDTTHELNTPISALMMSTSRVKEKKSYDEKIITNISISTKQLYEIYSSLTFLNFDNSNEKAEDLDFCETVKNSIEYFNELLKKKNITLELKENPCFIHISPTKAKMLINNLLGNAIKYSPPKKKIFIKLSEDSFSIQDQGIGIAKEKLDTIFQRFTRASSYAGGFGIGLNIVESIVKKYNYTIDIQSKEHQGTKVSINFRV